MQPSCHFGKLTNFMVLEALLFLGVTLTFRGNGVTGKETQVAVLYEDYHHKG